MESSNPFDELMHLFTMVGDPKCYFQTPTGAFSLPIVHLNKMLRFVDSFFQIVFGVQIAAFEYNGQTVKYDWSMTIEELLTIFGAFKHAKIPSPTITVVFTHKFEYKLPIAILPANILRPFRQVVKFWSTSYIQQTSRAHVFASAFQIYVARMLKSEQIVLKTSFTAEGILGYLEDIVSLTYPLSSDVQPEFWPNNAVTKLMLGNHPRAVLSRFRSKDTELEE